MAFGTATVLTNLGKSIYNNLLKGTGSEPKWIGVGVGAHTASRTAAATDTALSSEVETRVSGTSSVVTVGTTGDAYQVVGTITASAPRALDEAALFTASSGPSMFESLTFDTVNLSTGDSLQLTIRNRL